MSIFNRKTLPFVIQKRCSIFLKIIVVPSYKRFTCYPYYYLVKLCYSEVVQLEFLLNRSDYNE